MSSHCILHATYAILLMHIHGYFYLWALKRCSGIVLSEDICLLHLSLSSDFCFLLMSTLANYYFKNCIYLFEIGTDRERGVWKERKRKRRQKERGGVGLYPLKMSSRHKWRFVHLGNGNWTTLVIRHWRQKPLTTEQSLQPMFSQSFYPWHFAIIWLTSRHSRHLRAWLHNFEFILFYFWVMKPQMIAFWKILLNCKVIY